MARHQLRRDSSRPRQDASLTHEQFVHAVAALGIGLLEQDDDAKLVRSAKLTYGAGANTGARGVTYFNKWLKDKDEQAHFVEICAHGEDSPVQVAGTTLHELGHVLAGFEAGHKKAWHCACGKLGLRAIKAAGTTYLPAMFHPSIRARIMALVERISDGRPNGRQGFNGRAFVPRPCSAGVGTRGGTSRGAGSGSRLRKWVCACEKPTIARVASDSFVAECKRCYQEFKLIE